MLVRGARGKILFRGTDGPWACPCGGEIEADRNACGVSHTMPPCAGFLTAKDMTEIRKLITGERDAPS